jgi:PAS domain-containing protein
VVRRDAGGWESTAAVVFDEIALLSRVMAHLPHAQPFAMVAADGRVLAANRPLLEVLGCGQDELVGRPWTRFLPRWNVRPRPGGDVACFETWLATSGGRRRAHLLVDAIGVADAPAAYAVFVTPLPGGRLEGQRLRLGAVPA